MPDQQLVDGIQQVSDYIHTHGWHQGNFSDPNGRVCIQGSINNLCGDQTKRFVREFIEQTLIDRGDVMVATGINVMGFSYKGVKIGEAPSGGPFVRAIIPHFNDHVFKSKEEVLEFLAKARIKAEEQA